jgi:spoIIIJ-associated protein
MSKSIIAEGKTTNEAIEKGLKELKVSKNQVTIKVLENDDKRSFFSILAPRIVKVELTVNEDVQEKKENHNHKAESHIREPRKYSESELETASNNIKRFLDDFLNQIGDDAKYEVSTDENGVNVNINGGSASFLIGYRGETLYSFQNILVSLASKGLNTRVRVILDIEGYKRRREQTLEELAEKVAKTVVRTGRPVTLEPMKAYERKIIHSKLQDSTKVVTTSVGEEPRRRIVVSLK